MQHIDEYRSLYTTLRRLRGKMKRTSDNIKKTDANFVRSNNERLNRWREYFQKLYNHPTPGGYPVNQPSPFVASNDLAKGDNQECKNYRGIGLVSVVDKVFMTVIQQRLQTRHEQLAREEHAGFRPWRGCCDQVFTLRQLLEERIRCGKRLVAVFIDFAAAFDSVHQPALWRSLVAEVVDAVMRKVFKNRRGVQFGDNEFITGLMFADDSVVFAESESEASDIIQVLEFNSRRAKNRCNSRHHQSNRTSCSSVWNININIYTKMRIYKSLALSVLLYGAESWTLLQSDLKKLEVFRMRCPHRILNISIRDK
ncbi:unnamed protein product, partial [Adineta ricciae]